MAANFRSTCGSERGAPECSTQLSPAETPHAGQGTEDNCSGVSSLFFTLTVCDYIQSNLSRFAQSYGTDRSTLERMTDVTQQLLLAVPCPTCGVDAGKHCLLHTGEASPDPHIDRKLDASAAIETEKIPNLG
jgi:hypothetical protein